MDPKSAQPSPASGFDDSVFLAVTSPDNVTLSNASVTIDVEAASITTTNLRATSVTIDVETSDEGSDNNDISDDAMAAFHSSMALRPNSPYYLMLMMRKKKMMMTISSIESFFSDIDGDVEEVEEAEAAGKEKKDETGVVVGKEEEAVTLTLCTLSPAKEASNSATVAASNVVVEAALGSDISTSEAAASGTSITDVEIVNANNHSLLIEAPTSEVVPLAAGDAIIEEEWWRALESWTVCEEAEVEAILEEEEEESVEVAGEEEANTTTTAVVEAPDSNAVEKQHILGEEEENDVVIKEEEEEGEAILEEEVEAAVEEGDKEVEAMAHLEYSSLANEAQYLPLWYMFSNHNLRLTTAFYSTHNNDVDDGAFLPTWILFGDNAMQLAVEYFTRGEVNIAIDGSWKAKFANVLETAIGVTKYVFKLAKMSAKRALLWFGRRRPLEHFILRVVCK